MSLCFVYRTKNTSTTGENKKKAKWWKAKSVNGERKGPDFIRRKKRNLYFVEIKANTTTTSIIPIFWPSFFLITNLIKQKISS